jgi:hypothetical protein
MGYWVVSYQWVWTIYGYQLLPVRRWVQLYYAPVVDYYW